MMLELASKRSSVRTWGVFAADVVRAARKAVNSGLGELGVGCWLCSGQRSLVARTHSRAM